MSFGQAAAWGAGDPRLDRNEARVRRGFSSKIRRLAARLPFAHALLTAYYCAFDYATPLRVKGTLLAALAYFVLPFDFLPDMLPLIGFTDDAAVLFIALRMVSDNIRPEHHAAADAALDRMRRGE